MNTRTEQPSEILDRLPPSNVDAERQVLGSILLEPRILDEVAAILEAGDFYADGHKRIYSNLRAMHDANRQIDASLLLDRLRRAGELEAIGGTATLAEIAGSVAVHQHWKSHAAIVVRCSRKRQIIHAATDMLRTAWDNGAEPNDVLATAEQALSSIKTASYQNEPITMHDATVAAMGEIDAITQRGHLPGIMIGLPEFDAQLGGLFPGELTIIAARPGQGKTSIALQMAAHCASRGRRVYFATLEMAAAELALKRLCAEAGVSSQAIRAGRINATERALLCEAAGRVAVKNMILHDWAEIRPFDIARTARRCGAEIIFVDYLQIVSPPDASKRRYEQVGDISRQLKTIARQMNVPVVACAQIGRQAEQGKEDRPKLAHLRESGNIENDADVALLLWRPDDGIVGKAGGRYAGERWDAELEVAKNRKGIRTRFRLNWNGTTTTFTDATPKVVDDF